MTTGLRPMEYRSLHAPSEDGGVLIAPPLAAVGPLLDQQRSRRASSRATIADLPWRQFSEQARGELLSAAARYTSAYRDFDALPNDGPVILAGHQPEMFHPGVWFKNFVLGDIARRHRGVGVNLVIDSDTLRAGSIRVPGGSIDAPTVSSIVYDAACEEIPHEERPILDRSLLASFADRVTAEVAPLVPRPLIRQLWPLVLEQAQAQDNLGQCLAQGRHRLEGRWGCSTLELPQSQVCDLPSFRRFTAYLLRELPRLQAAYNEAVAEYRRVHHLRGTSHPVPELVDRDGWLESPLWTWRSDDPRRRRLFARRAAGGLQLTDHHHDPLHLPLDDHGSLDAPAEALAALAQQGIKIRTRALITTLWARLMLGDLFLHGIGGAKYDQVTDRMISELFGIEPPPYLTVTATLRLPIERPAVGRDELLETRQRLRQLTYQPERFIDPQHAATPLDAPPRQAEELISAKRRWIETQATVDNARERCRAIRRINESLQPWVEGQRRRLEAQQQRLATRLQAEGVLASREYSFCLFPEERLRDFYTRILGD